MNKKGVLLISIPLTIIFLANSRNRFLLACDGSLEKKWFIYVGTKCYPGTATLADIRNPNNYTEAPSWEVVMCDDKSFLCAICAYEDGTTGKPLIRSIDQIYKDLATYHNAPSGYPASILEKGNCAN